MSEGRGTGLDSKAGRVSWEEATSIGARDNGSGPQVQQQSCVVDKGSLVLTERL